MTDITKLDERSSAKAEARKTPHVWRFPGAEQRRACNSTSQRSAFAFDSTPRSPPIPPRGLEGHISRNELQQEEQPHGLPPGHNHGPGRRTSPAPCSRSTCSVNTHVEHLSDACAQPAIAYFIIQRLLTRLDPDAQQKEEARRKASAATRKLGAILSNKTRDAYDSDSDEDYERRKRSDRPRIEDLHLTAYEQTIAMEVVAPEEIPVSFDGTCFPPTAMRASQHRLDTTMMKPLNTRSQYTHRHRRP